MNIGEELRRARQDRELSIGQIAQSTKISARLLQAIEINAFGELPGGLFTRGYLRAYAREVGLDPEDVVREYRAECEQVEAVRETAAPVRSPVESEFNPPRLSINSPGIGLALALAFTVSVIYLAAHHQPTAASPARRAATTAALGSSSAPARPVGTSGEAQRATIPVPQTVKLELQAQGACWVEAIADGKRAVARLMSAGDHEAVTAREKIRLRVGEPSALSVRLNGVPGRSLGQAGIPVTVEITPQNSATFAQR